MADSRRANRSPFDPPPAAVAVQRGERPWPEAPHQAFVESWWTPRRVSALLHLYRAIAETLVDYGSPSVWNTDGVFGPGDTEPSWAHLSGIKADLDRAIEGLRPRLRSVADRYWRHCYSQDEIGHRDRLSQQRVGRLVEEAKDAIIGTLCQSAIV